MAGPYYVDGAVGNDANAGTSEGAGNAWATIQKAEDTLASGEKVWIKASATYSEDVTLKTNGTATGAITWEGYSTTIGDNGRFTIGAAAIGINDGALTGSGFRVFKNMRVTGGSSHGVAVAQLDALTFKNCRIDSNGGVGVIADDLLQLELCEIDGNTLQGVDCDHQLRAIGCSIHGNGSHGIDCKTGVVFGCVLYGNSGSNILISVANSIGSATAVAINNTIDGQNISGSVGINISSGNTLSAVVVNNIVHDCDTCISVGRNLGELAISRNNLVFPGTGNTAYNAFDTFEGEITSDPQFVDEANSDYKLASASPAKAAGVDAGQTVNSVSHVDIGGHQRLEPAGTGRIVLIG